MPVTIDNDVSMVVPGLTNSNQLYAYLGSLKDYSNRTRIEKLYIQW